MAEHVLRRNVAAVRPRAVVSTTESKPGFTRFGLAGAFGGLGAFLLGRLTGAGPFAHKPLALDLPAEIVLGCMAALFAIYLLAKSDVAQPETLIFAILCGLCWNPVIKGAQAYLHEYTDSRTTDGTEAARQMAAQFRAQSNAQADKSILAASSQITTALKKLPDVSSASARQTIVNNSAQVVESIPASTATLANVDAIRNIGLTSVKTNAPTVSVASYKRLREIAQSAPSEQTRAAAANAAATIAQVSPTIAAAKK